MKKALLLEDDSLFKTVFTSILRRNGFEVTNYSSPVFVIAEVADLRKFDLIVTDNNMPYMNGLEFLKYIKDYKLTDQRICFNSADYEITTKAKNENLCFFNIRKSPVELELFLQDNFN